MTDLQKEIRKAIEICEDLQYPKEVIERISKVKRIAEIEQILYSTRRNLD